jgi:hypothetical protein
MLTRVVRLRRKPKRPFPERKYAVADIMVGSSFPSDLHEAVAEVVNRWLRAQSEEKRNKPPGPWFEFASAWEAVKVRYRTCCEHDQTFTHSIKGTSHEDIYVQERELFGFFTTGLAAIESFFYALYAFGWMLKPSRFDLIVSDQKKVASHTTRDAFRKEYGTADPLVDALESVLKDPSWKEWNIIRNVLAHRGAPGRKLHVGISIGAAPQPKTDFLLQESRLMQLGSLDEKTTRTRREWLEATLITLLKATKLFATKQVPP